MQEHSKQFRTLNRAIAFYRWGQQYADAIFDLKLHSNMDKTVFYVHWKVK